LNLSENVCFGILAQQLTNEGYIKNVAIQGSFGCTIMLLPKGEEALQNNDMKIFLAETSEMKLSNPPKMDISYRLNIIFGFLYENFVLFYIYLRSTLFKPIIGVNNSTNKQQNEEENSKNVNKKKCIF
jgi:hypothetical protein